MAASQTGDALRSFGAWGYPRLVGALVLVGVPADDAARHVRAVVRRELAGLAGGTEAGRLLEQVVFDTTREPPVPVAASGPVGEALAELGWDERLATVAALGFYDLRLGPGRPEVIVAALDDGADPAAAVADAIQQHAPPPEPELIASLQRELRRRRTLTATVVALVLLVLAAAAIVLVVQRDGGAAAPPSTTAPDYAITQWVAVLDYGPDAFSLYEGVEEVGDIVGVYAFTDAWSCYTGFPAREVTADDDWFLGVAAQDRAQLDALVAQLDRQPLLTALVRQTCVLPPP